MSQNRTWRPGVAAAAIASFALAVATMPAARAATFDFHIPAEGAPKALNDLAAQAHVQLLFDYKAFVHLRTQPVNGAMEVTHALALLLRGTGFTFQRVNDRTIAITPSAANTGPARVKPARPSFRDAQDPPQSAAPAVSVPMPAPAKLTEIVVTATRRSERLVDAPVAVSVITSQSLSAAGIHGTSSLTQLVPSLSFQGGNHSMNTAFYIRGVGTQLFNPGLEPDVSVVLDGVALASNAQEITDLEDIQRIEVLRGPQSTLFGKNAIAGLIHIVTAPPSKRLEGRADATFAQGGVYRVGGTLSGPVTRDKKLRARLTAYYDDVGGNIYNVPNRKMINNSIASGARATILWMPTHALSFSLMGDYRHTHAYCCQSTFIRVTNPLLRQILASSRITPGINNRGDAEAALIWEKTDQSMVSLTGKLRLGAGTVTSITAYQHFEATNNQPAFGLATPSTPLYLPFGLGALDVNGGPFRISQFTQELRFTSPGGQRLNYLVGLYYLHHSIDRGPYAQRLGLGCAPGEAPAAYGLPCKKGLWLSDGNFRSNSQDDNISAYGHIDFRLAGALSVLGGLRVQHDHVTYWANRPAQTVVSGDILFRTPAFGSGATSDTAATGEAGLKYAVNRNSSAYLTWSTGYKGAGYNLEIGALLPSQKPVKPETATDWEIGYKTLAFQGRLRFSGDVFYEKFQNLQVQATNTVNVGGSTVTQFMPVNAGNAWSRGVELNFDSRPVAPLTVSGGVTYLETNVDVAGLQCPLNEQAAAPVIASRTAYNTCYYPSASAGGPVLNVRNGRLPQAPRWRGDLVARYTHEVPGTGLAGFLQVSATSQSQINFSLNQDSTTVQRRYTITNLSIGVLSLSGHYHVSLFVNNLFNQHYVTLMGAAVPLTSAKVTPDNVVGIVPRGANRYFGATVGVSF